MGKLITFSIKPHDRQKETREITFLMPDNCPERNFVYRLSNYDNTICYIGSIGDEGIERSYAPRFSDKKDRSGGMQQLAEYLERYGDRLLILEPIYQHSNRNTLYLLEQIGILNEAWGILQKKGLTKITKDSNIFDFAKDFEDTLLNKRFDRKDMLRYWLAHPETLNPDKFKFIPANDETVAI